MTPKDTLRHAFCASLLAAAALPLAAAAQAPRPEGTRPPDTAMAPADPPAAAPDVPAPAIDAQAGAGVSIGGVTVTGESIERDPETGLITVTGSPHAVRGDEDLRAVRFIINPDTGQFTAEGNVVFRQGVQIVRGTRATFNFNTGEGRVEDVNSLYNTYYLKAEEVFVHRGPAGPFYVARRGRITTCDKRDPHYDLAPRTLTIYPQDKLIALNTGIDFLGFRLLTVPKVVKSLKPKEEQEHNPYPSFGYDHRWGGYAKQEFDLIHKRPVWLDAHAALYMFHEPSGGLLVATPGHLQAVGALFYRDDAENQRSRRLQVSRLPEVGAVWTSYTERPRTGRFLSHQVAGVNRPEFLDYSREWRFAAEVTGGFFRQHHGDDTDLENSESKNGARGAIQGQAILPWVKMGPISLNDMRFMARQSIYDTGDEYTVLGTGIGKQVKVGKHVRLRVDRFDQWTGGESPFLFDTVELKQEWRPRFDYDSKQFHLSYFARIRGQNGNLYDQVFSVSKLFHCIEPRLTYSVRRGSLLLDITIPGFSGGRPRSRPGEPRTIDTGDEQLTPVSPPTPPAVAPPAESGTGS